MPKLDLQIQEVSDSVARENFDRIERLAKEDVFNRFEGKHFAFSTSGAVTDFVYPHYLGFQPLDVIQTSVIGGTITWNYDKFTKDTLNFTTSAAVDVRAFIGRYEEE